MGFDWTFAMNAYGDKWRRGRRAFHGQLHQGVARNYEGVQMREARIFQQQLLDNPEDLPGLIRGFVLCSWAEVLRAHCYVAWSEQRS